MSLLVTGSIGIDTVITPFGHAESVLGGSAVYFSLIASQFTPVRLVGVVGEDFPPEFRRVLEARPIDLAGLEVRRGSRTFRWSGKFEGAMNEAETLNVHLNVLAEAPPPVPHAFLDSRIVFLANTHPGLQKALIQQLHAPKLIVCDTMNLWIRTQRSALLEVFSLVDGVIINDAEARELTDRVNLVEAAQKLLTYGPKFAVVKKGENGALLVTEQGTTSLPAFPTTRVCDPTGAGDTFAGGILGYLAQCGDAGPASLRRAVARGMVAASFTIEDFSVGRLRTLTRREFDVRLEEYLRMLHID